MPQVLRSVNRTAYLAAFAAACVLFAPPSAWAEGMGGAPVLTATAGDGEVDLSWTEWTPPADDDFTNGTIQYAWRMKVEGDAEWLETTYISGTSTTVGGSGQRDDLCVPGTGPRAKLVYRQLGAESQPRERRGDRDPDGIG